jgi:hypothetical protein
MGDSMYCVHDRLAASCEDCQFVRALERNQPDALRQAAGAQGLDRAPVNATPEQEQDVVEQDTHVMRPDLDSDLGTEGAYTLVRAGDVVPTALADYPRQAGSYQGPNNTKNTRTKTKTSTDA